MIKFNLTCNNLHGFEAWFSTSTDFDDQKTRDLISCPQCGSKDVQKALMVPALSTGKYNDQKQQMLMSASQQETMKNIRDIVKQVKANTEDVGNRFPQEARKIHYGETEPRGIYGKTSIDEARELIDEGIKITPLPSLPDEQN